MPWTNSDGLQVRFHREEGDVSSAGRLVAADGEVNVVEWDLDALKFNGITGTQYETPSSVFLPQGAIITSASFVVTTAFVSGGSTTLDVGFQRENGTEIDNDGIYAALAKASLDAVGERPVANGALVAATGTTPMPAQAYLYVKANVAAFTAGKGRLVIKYTIAV